MPGVVGELLLDLWLADEPAGDKVIYWLGQLTQQFHPKALCVCVFVCCVLLLVPVQVPLNEYDFAGQKLCNVQLQVSVCVCVCV